MVKISLNDLSPELTEEELREQEGAEKTATVSDDDSPQMMAEQLAQFKPIHQENE